MKAHARTRACSIGCLLAAGLVLAFATTATGAARDIQIVDVDFETGIIELYNFGAGTEDLSGWRFCSHDEDEAFRYSSSTALNGVSIASGASLFIHFNNDAPAEPDRINRPSGAFATPLDPGPYSLGLYFAPVQFGNGATIADHLQWSTNGVDNATADERSDEAVSGGVWTSETAWIATEPDTGGGSPTSNIELKSASGGLVLHGPADYLVPEPRTFLVQATALVALAVLRRARQRLDPTPH